MSETDCFTIEIEGEELEISEVGMQDNKIYRIDSDRDDYRIEIKNGSWVVYVNDHTVNGSRNSLSWDSISGAWKWVRDDIKKRIREEKIS